MYIEPEELKGTKFIVPAKDAVAAQKVLFKHGYGRVLGLSDSKVIEKTNYDMAFIVRYDNTFVSIDKEFEDEFWYVYFRSDYLEINWECLF
jgi:hypothetical protein